MDRMAKQRVTMTWADCQGALAEHGSIGCGRMVEQVSSCARPRWGAGHAHQGDPLVFTENSLLLRATAPLQLLLAPIASEGFSIFPCS